MRHQNSDDIFVAIPPGHSDHLTYEDLERWLEGALDDIDRELIDGHLEECALCRNEAADLKKVRSPIREVVPPSVRARGRARWWLSMAAVIAIALMTAFLLSRRQPVPSLPGRPVVPQEPPSANRTIPSPPRTVLSAEMSQRIEEVLRTERLRKPEIVEELVGEASPLLGVEEHPRSFAVIEPVGTLVVEAAPRFRWDALPGATAYEVTVADAMTGAAAAEGGSENTSWRPRSPLVRGRTYSWQVKAHRDDKVISSPRPPAPEALFRVATEAQSAQIASWRAAIPAPDHLTWGIVLAENGFMEDAERELALASAAGDAKADALLKQVRSWRSHPPFPTRTKGAQ